MDRTVKPLRKRPGNSNKPKSFDDVNKLRLNPKYTNFYEEYEPRPSDTHLDLDTKINGILMETAVVPSNCEYRKCKIRTTLMGHKCEYCKKPFCVKHCPPEAHGCGDAKKEANKRLKKFQQQEHQPSVQQQQKNLINSKRKLAAVLKNGTVEKSNVAEKTTSSSGVKKIVNMSVRKGAIKKLRK